MLKKLLANDYLKWGDYLYFFLVIVTCFFLFNHGDITHTGGSSIGLLNTPFWNFYEYNMEFDIYDSYLISTYILFAIWSVPLKLLGIVAVPSLELTNTGIIMWWKLLPALFFFACGYLVYKIAEEIGMGENKAKLAAFVFLTSPIAVFSQFIFGQYDSFTLFFVLLGIYYYFNTNKNSFLKFVVFFGIAITFKYFALLYFLPLLLLREKNIWRIIKYCIIVVLPYLIEVLIYLPGYAFRKGVFGFWATGYIFDASIDLTRYSISIVTVFCVGIFAWAYFTNASGNESIKWAIYYLSLISFAVFGLSSWHPQWLLLMTPILVLGAFIHKDTKVFMILDIFLMLFFVVYCVNNWSGGVDQSLFKLGILGDELGTKIANGVQMYKLFFVTDMNLVISLFTSILFVSTFFKHPKYTSSDFGEKVECIGWIRTRFLVGVSIFLVPAFICMILSCLN